MAQLVKHLLYKHEDLGSHPEHLGLVRHLVSKHKVESEGRRRMNIILWFPCVCVQACSGMLIRSQGHIHTPPSTHIKSSDFLRHIIVILEWVFQEQWVGNVSH